jgi:glyoxylate carboligase
MAYTVADQIIEVLVHAGVRRVYGLVGDSLNPLADSIRRNPAIEWVHVHNEEAAALAAAAEAQLTAVLPHSRGWGGTRRPGRADTTVKGYSAGSYEVMDARPVACVHALLAQPTDHGQGTIGPAKT